MCLHIFLILLTYSAVMHDTAEMYREFICSIHRLDHIVSKLFDKELHIIEDSIKFDDIVVLYYFTEDQYQIEHDDSSYRKHIKMIADKLIRMGLLEKADDVWKLTALGQEVKTKFDNKLSHHAKNLMFKGLMSKELSHVLTLMSRFEVFWSFILSVK